MPLKGAILRKSLKTIVPQLWVVFRSRHETIKIVPQLREVFRKRLETLKTLADSKVQGLIL